jgi:hypothetical protein
MSEASDFWWLSDAEANQDLVVGVGHHEPFTDEYEPDLSAPNAAEPTIRGWKHSLGDSGDLSELFRWYPLEFLHRWRSECRVRNVYRTVRLVSRENAGRVLLGPFLIDIDNQGWTNGYSEDVGAALDVVRQTAHLLAGRGLKNGRDFRVFFSGRKGFNIEVVPSSLGIDGDERAQITTSARVLEEIVGTLTLGATNVDRIYGNRFGYRLKYPYIRLHNSLNCWKGPSGALCRQRIEVSLPDLSNLRAAQIIERSELT